jgi:beta-glucosidase
MTKLFFSILALVAISELAAQTAVYKDHKQPIDNRVKDLLQRMTVEEKAGQLNQLNGGFFTGPATSNQGDKEKMELVRQGKVGSFLNIVGARETRAMQEIAVKESRLGIPILFAYDVIHGYKTIFPIPLAEACSWDLAQITKNSSVAAKEASSAGLHWTFAPMCDVSNDIRWGRVMEGAGEDPYLGGLISAARVKGLQGDLSDNSHIMACVKHFAAYGAIEAGREYNTVDISRFMLWNKYLPPYKAAVDAGAATVMNSFNIFEGVPASGNKYLVTDVLKKKWGFKGFVVSDWNSFGEMIDHGYATDNKDAALKALQAGSSMDMETSAMVNNVPALVKEGKISVQQLDNAIYKILWYKFRLGLFDDPFKFSDPAREAATLFTDANRQQAREAARGAIVLLKNDGNVLPLNNVKKVALIGAFANSKEDMFDFWIAQGTAKDAVTIHDGLKNAFGNNVAFSFTAGYNTDGTSSEMIMADAIKNALSADVVLVNIGISGKMAGEDRALANPVIPDVQLQLLEALKKTGKPLVAIVTSGRPLVLTNVLPYADAILQCWILGTETGNAVADVVTGKFNPSGKTVMSFPYAVGQIPVYYNHFNTGRPIPPGTNPAWKSRYRDIPNEPLYPFGFGLSYTSYNYSGMKLEKSTMSKNDKLGVSLTVTNTGSVEGVEVVQLYIRDVTASVVRPVKELKAFQRITIKPGESRVVTFSLDTKDLSFYDAQGNSILESGEFRVMVGGNSRDVMEAKVVLRD